MKTTVDGTEYYAVPSIRCSELDISCVFRTEQNPRAGSSCSLTDFRTCMTESVVYFDEPRYLAWLTVKLKGE